MAYPVGDRARDRYRARIATLIATSDQAAAAAAPIYPGEYTMIPAPGLGAFRAPGQAGTQIAADGRAKAARLRTLVKTVAATPVLELVLVWSRHTRRPIGRTSRRPRAAGCTCEAPRTRPSGPPRSVTPTCSSPLPAATMTWRGRRVPRGGAVVSALPSGALEPPDPGLGYARQQPALAAAAAARLIEDTALRDDTAGARWPPPSAASRRSRGSSTRCTPASASGGARTRGRPTAISRRSWPTCT